MDSETGRLPPGRQPYDSINGLRVGAVAGGVLGAVVAVVTRAPWLIVAGAVAGGGAGFWWERLKLRGAGDDESPGADDAS